MSGLSHIRAGARWAGAGLAFFFGLVALPATAASPGGVGLGFDSAVQYTVAPDPFDQLNEAGKPAKAKRGTVVRLVIRGTVGDGFYTYPLSVPGQPASSKVSRITTRVDPGIVPLPPFSETPPEAENSGKEVEYKLKKSFVWGVDFLVLPDAKPGPHKVEFQIRSQACNDSNCFPFKRTLEAVIDVSDAPAEKLEPYLEKRWKDALTAAPKPEPKTDQKTDSPGAKVAGSRYLPADLKASLERVRAEIRNEIVVAEQDTGLLAFVLAGMFWGAVSLVTPCVFPMIPITVSFFLKQSEKEHSKPLTMASVYCATIVIVLTIAALALLNFFRFLSVNPLMNIGLGLLFVFFALSLFGMYEIQLPSGLARFTSEREGKGGLLGTVFMALTFTIVSFACVAPFLGGFGGTAALTERPWWHTFLGALAFSATFAAPFFLLALFPALLRKMPKSGSWLNSVKVVMGFLELAAALNFFRAAELALLQTPTFFTFDFVLACYIVLSVLCGLYLLGVYRLGHDTPLDHLSVPRLLFSFMFLAFALHLVPGLFTYNADGDRVRPRGTVYAWVSAFLLPDARLGGKSEEAWGANLEYAIETAREHRRKTGSAKLIFIDFTGVQCKNCALNEENVFPKSEVQRLFQAYELVQIYTDTVPIKQYPPGERARVTNDRQLEDADLNREFERKVFNDSRLPLYAILEPRLDNTVHVVAVYPEGLINDQAAFVEFLRKPLATAGTQVAQGR